MALPTLAHRFWSKVQRTPTCWLWKGAKQKGYGAFWIGEKIVRAHRWVLGVDDPEVLVLHKCDVRACVRRSHLVRGTQKDNMRDCVAKGRLGRNGLAGATVKSSKLRAHQVRRIRRLYAKGTHTQVELGEMFGVTHRAIGYVLHGDTWKHIR